MSPAPTRTGSPRLRARGATGRAGGEATPRASDRRRRRRTDRRRRAAAATRPADRRAKRRGPGRRAGSASRRTRARPGRRSGRPIGDPASRQGVSDRPTPVASGAASVAGRPRAATARTPGVVASCQQPIEVLGGVGDEVDVERADPLLEDAPHRLAEVGDRPHQRQPGEPIRPDRRRRRRPAAARSSSAVSSWLIEKLPRSKNGSPIPAYSQSTIRIRVPSSMKFALSRSLWHGRSSTGSARKASSIRRAIAWASSYSGGIVHPAGLGQRPVGLDDPERHEQARDRRPVVDPAERIGDPGERRRADGPPRRRPASRR